MFCIFYGSLKIFHDLLKSEICCLKSITYTVHTADYLIFDKTLFFEGASIGTKNLRVNKILTGGQNVSQNT